MYNIDRDEEEIYNKKEKVPFKDLIAIMIAQYSILMPIAIGACVVFALLMFFIIKVLMRA